MSKPGSELVSLMCSVTASIRVVVILMRSTISRLGCSTKLWAAADAVDKMIRCDMWLVSNESMGKESKGEKLTG